MTSIRLPWVNYSIVVLVKEYNMLLYNTCVVMLAVLGILGMLGNWCHQGSRQICKFKEIEIA